MHGTDHRSIRCKTLFKEELCSCLLDGQEGEKAMSRQETNSITHLVKIVAREEIRSYLVGRQKNLDCNYKNL